MNEKGRRTGVLVVAAILLILCIFGILKALFSGLAGEKEQESASVSEGSVISATDLIPSSTASVSPSIASSTSPGVVSSEPSASFGQETSSGKNLSSESEAEAPVITPEPIVQKEDEEIAFDPTWLYADCSKINDGVAKLYYAAPEVAKDITVCINAGHGTKGGSNVKTLCHPDGTPKVTGGTTEAGATYAYAVSTGMDFADGTPEREGNLKLALIVKEKLLDAGYNVLMIRETDDVQLDNIARTLMANAYADCHIAIHYDSTSSDKGAYFMSVPSNTTYRNMEPVKSHWEEHNALGNSVIKGLRETDAKVMGDGSIEMDLTQTSFSTVPSIDLEVGDKVSDRSDETLNKIADGIVLGIGYYFTAE